MKERVLFVLRLGMSRREAARNVGFDESTIRRAMKVDDEFRLSVAEAEASMEVNYLGRLNRQSEKSWRASAWVLERLRPERYSAAAVRGMVATQPDKHRLLDMVLEALHERAAGPEGDGEEE